MGMKRIIALVSLGFLLLACDPPEVDVPVSSVSLDKTSVELKVGETVRLSATVLPADAKDKTVTWTSSSQSVATVSPSGEVKAVAVGSASITASAGGKSASCSVKVSESTVSVTSVTLDKDRLDLTVGGTAKLTATVLPADASDKNVTWESSDTSVATVDNDGNVKALKGGTSTVTAKAGGKSASALVDVMDVTPTSFDVAAEGGDIQVTVITTRKYQVESKPEWVTEASVANQVHTFKVAANEEITERSGVIVICDEIGTCLSCSVRQAGAEKVFTVSPEKVDLGAAGGTFDVTVTANYPVHLSSMPDWVTRKSVKDGVYTFEAPENKEITERSGVIVFCDDEGVCLPCSVKQAGAAPFFSISPEKVDMKADGGTFTVTVTANHPYHLSSAPDWVTEKSFKDDVYTFEVAANEEITERSGVVVICDDAGVCLPCSVKQAGAAPFFSISPEKVDMKADGGTFTVTVTANHPYHLSSTPDWVTMKSQKDNVYTFEAEANPDTKERKGVVVICDDKGTCLSCTVKQAGKDVFEISPTEVSMESDGGTFEVTVTATRTYHISSTPDWVKQKSQKDNVYTFEVEANPDTKERKGVVVICDDKGTCLSCTVKQDGADVFRISPENVEFDAEGGTFDITVTATRSYHISSTPDWVTQKSVKDNVYTFEVGFNSSESERSGVVVICDDKGICLSCIVKQEGVKPFDVNPKQVNVRYDGGTFEVKVTSSYGYHLNAKPDWVTQKSVKDKVHTFEVGPSPTSDVRSGVITFCDDKGTCLSMTVRQDGDPNMIDWNREFYHNPMILSFICTGSWGYRKYRSAIEEAFGQMPAKPILVNLHMWDDFELNNVQTLRDRYVIYSPITSIIDGRRRVGEYQDKDIVISKIKEYVEETEANYPVASAIGFESSVSGQKLDVDVMLYFKLAGDYKVTVFVSESGVVAGQYDDDDEYIENYRLDDFVRMVITDIDGDPVSASALSSKKLHYSISIPSGINKDNLKVTVAVQRAYGSQRRIGDDGYDYGEYYFDNCATGKVGKAVPPAMKNDAGGGNEDVTNGDPVNW